MPIAVILFMVLSILWSLIIRRDTRSATLLGVAYVHLLTISENAVLSTVGTFLRFPIWGLAIIQALSIPRPDSRNFLNLSLHKGFKIFTALFIIWSAISLLWSVDRFETLVKVLNFSLIIIFMQLSYRRLWQVNFQLALSDLRIFTRATVFYISLSALFTIPAIVAALSGGDRYQGLFHNPNTIAALVAVFFFPSILLYQQFKSKHLLLYPLILLTSLFLSGSRTSTLAILAALGLTLFLAGVRNLVYASRILPRLIGVFYIGLTAYVWSVATNRTPMESALPRQLNFSLSDSLFNGREELWFIGWRIFQENFLLGYGLNGSRTALSSLANNGEYFGEATQFHSSYIEIIVDLGIIGGILFSGLLLCMAFQAGRISNRLPLLVASVISPLILAISESALFGLSSIVAINFWLLVHVIFAVPNEASPNTRTRSQLLATDGNSTVSR